MIWENILYTKPLRDQPPQTQKANNQETSEDDSTFPHWHAHRTEFVATTLCRDKLSTRKSDTLKGTDQFHIKLANG